MQNLLKKHAEVIRFAIVGAANTVIDFSILFLLVNLGLDKIPANYISTFVAFISSFFINKSYTFKSTGGNTKKQFGLFIVITIIGLWVIQPIVILTISPAVASLGFSSGISLLASKLVATLASMIWNYLLYSRIVFKKEK